MIKVNICHDGVLLKFHRLSDTVSAPNISIFFKELFPS